MWVDYNDHMYVNGPCDFSHPLSGIVMKVNIRTGKWLGVVD